MSNDAILLYSTFVALLALVSLVAAAALVVYRLALGREAAAGLLGDRATWMAWLVALVATIGSLIYSEVIHFEPCRLCWFQRIAMYPLAVVLLVGAIRKERQVKFYGLPLSLVGLAVSVYHYLIQHIPGLEGGACNPDNPCSNIFVEIFGFITIPFMAGSGFIVVTVLLGLYVNHKATAQEEPGRVSRKNLILWSVGGVVGLGLIVLLAFSIAGEGSVDESIGFGEVTVEGTDLPFMQGQASDPAVGMTAPTVSGSDWEGNEFTIGPDGRAKIVVMLAHWCPHCQAEVPVIQDWLEAGGLPEGVDLYGVTVLTNRLRGNWPPQDWLEAEGGTAPTIMDDQDGTVVTAYGLTSTPTYVVLGPDNENLGRLAGEIGVNGLDAIARIAADSLEG